MYNVKVNGMLTKIPIVPKLLAGSPFGALIVKLTGIRLEIFAC